jgi:hypothetical protein
VEKEFSFLNKKVIQSNNKKNTKTNQVLSGEKPCLDCLPEVFFFLFLESQVHLRLSHAVSTGPTKPWGGTLVGVLVGC